MSYQDTLDRRSSIKAAKSELEHFSDLLKLHQDMPYLASSKSNDYNSITNVIQYMDYDQKQIHMIDKNDKQIEYIHKVLVAISKLDEEELQLIYTKYVLMYSNEEVEKTLLISESKRKRLLREGLFDFAIAMKVEVVKIDTAFKKSDKV